MIFASLLSLLPALLAASEAPSAPGQGVTVMTVERQVTLRVPVQPRPRLRLRWEEAEGPKCLPTRAIAAAMLSGPDSIDFLMRKGRRMRARLDSDCEGLDFYGGLYLQPEDQRRVCANRDVIRSRAGATCRIESFHYLVPKIRAAERRQEER